MKTQAQVSPILKPSFRRLRIRAQFCVTLTSKDAEPVHELNRFVRNSN
jgi:hypothetical protein